VMTNDWYYAEGDNTVGPLDLKEMEAALSKASDPRNLWVWKVGSKDWERAGDVKELAALIYKPPSLPHKRSTSQGIWYSAGAIGVSLIGVWVASDYFIGAPVAALPLVAGLDWATRRRRQFAGRQRHE
jgi:hypothetical protein